ncbi:Homogentisate 1,2-dioxygenase [Phyllosticta paracitricarpa]|uniref:homogentisate 1,2-dioxygenase n=1 Tax=Phyllosticta paracitricarpa TaxID=2016321 RepID=A0ABR1ND44_9PEZI
MPSSKFAIEDHHRYATGLNSYPVTESSRSEAIAGALPKAQNLPQKHHLGLYPERISGSSFTAKRAVNKQTFMWRILPSAAQSSWTPVSDHPLNSNFHTDLTFLPDQLSWKPFKVEPECNFIDGLRVIGGAGDPTVKNGVAYYSFSCGADMDERSAFYSADGDWLIVPQLGALDIQTELGMLRVRPREICVVPRGIRFRVTLPSGQTRGYVIETFSGHFDVPELGVIGSLGLANLRDFEIPTAAFEDTDAVTTLLVKMGGKVSRASLKGSAFNAVAWHGTYYPFKYDLSKFMPMGSTLYDHQDPSIYTVLTCPSDKPDHPAVDFIYIGPRWIVMEDTLHVPYFHRNTMSEFAAVISGGFDTSPIPDELVGMCNLHNGMSTHGPSAPVVEHSMTRDTKPERIPEDHVAVLVESCYPIGLTEWALKLGEPDVGGDEKNDFGGYKRVFDASLALKGRMS